MYEPRPGDYGVVRSTGLFARLIQIGTLSRWNHAVIYIGNGTIVEANPTGVETSPVSRYENIAWNQHEELNDFQRMTIVNHAISLVGKPYNFLNIAGLMLRIVGIKFLGNWILKHLADHQGYICSELVAECYRLAGNVLVSEKDYLVNPGDLAERLIWQ